MAHGGFNFVGLSIPIITSGYYDVVSDDDDDDDDQNISPYGLGPKKCAVCAKQGPAPLIVCSSCKVVFYCGTAHQAIDQPQHSSPCSAIKRTREKLHGKDEAFRAGYCDSRHYMKAIFATAHALLKIDTVPAMEQALAHFSDVLRFDGGDKLGVENIVPGLLLRLGREQECYDFLKGWALMDYTGIRGADAFEPIDLFFSREDLSLSHLAILTLLKLRLYLDLEQVGRSDYHNDEDELFGRPLGSLVRARMRSRRNVSATAAVVERQYRKLCQVVDDVNPYFWEALVDGDIPPLPDSCRFGTVEEAHLAVHQCRAAWHESEDAIVMAGSDTAQFTSVYGGRLAGAGAGAGDPHWQGDEALKRANNLPKDRATGDVFPSKFQPPLPTSHPTNLFPPTPTGPQQTLRFVGRNDQTTALVYTDGACANNGQTNPRGGWAMVLGPAYGGEGSIVSGRLEETGPFDDSQDCVATSNRAELRAAIAALRLRAWEKEGLCSIVIATDSSYVVEGATDWVRAWVRNGWRTRKGGHVKNRDLWDLLLGEVERWVAQGGRVAFWKIPRELNGNADGAAKAAAHGRPSVMAFTDPVESDAQPSALLLYLEHESLFDTVHGHLATRIAAKAKMEGATTVEAALAILGRRAPPSIILVADGAITRHRKVCEAVMDCLRGGSTVVLAGCFSSMVSSGEFNRFFARIGLPWQQGLYERKMVDLGRNVVHARLASRLPSTYSQKAVFVKKVAPSAAWYTLSGSSGQTAMAFAQVGLGRLGYVGDVNGEDVSDMVVLAMCGLLG
ncbi:uncharacterized protein B0H64DRAFT_412139 [Chaetomium fimeti]|uniref:ribonuclease H n=1 Tax=Chaetomium fimeti TaxID=1854472 RepID=A0AAE0H6D0_9PEZI|nr:hypothetical protein B0H64DRAFT_412139 [Chaetomium fimeti]